MVMYREVCPERVQNECPGGVWCRGFMSWGDTLILVISRGVQLYYGIAHFPRPYMYTRGCGYARLRAPRDSSVELFTSPIRGQLFHNASSDATARNCSNKRTNGDWLSVFGEKISFATLNKFICMIATCTYMVQRSTFRME